MYQISEFDWRLIIVDVDVLDCSVVVVAGAFDLAILNYPVLSKHLGKGMWKHSFEMMDR